MRSSNILRAQKKSLNDSKSQRTKVIKRHLSMEKLEARRVLSVMMIGDSSQAAPMIQRVGTWATITGSGYCKQLNGRITSISRNSCSSNAIIFDIGC